ncbi:MAG: calcium/sodium antiporter [Saprospiraceae bacterium]|nr:calcium/sodium antiporter [Saprospiraceae bacterium]
MDALLYFGMLALSLAALLKGSGWFVGAAETMGKAWGVSPFIIGVTIVAFGTSLPELASSITAVVLNESSLVAGNVIGSNITNILLVLGLVAIVAKDVRLEFRVMDLDIPLLAGSSLLLYFALYDGQFSRHEAVLFLVALVVFLLNSFKGGAPNPEPKEERIKAGWKPYAILIASGILVYFGSNYTVLAIQQLSTIFGIESEFFALTVIALGTSLPEVMVSVTAARNNNTAIAVGNVLGSNIFNTYAVMGIPSFFGTLEIPASIMEFSLPFMVGVTMVFAIISVSNKISRWEGVMLVLFYLFFLAELMRSILS